MVLARERRQQVVALRVPLGCTAREAVGRAVAAGLECGEDIDPLDGPIGVYGERVEDGRRLHEGDRVELYRPLLRDPKERRRAVAAGSTPQGSSSGGGMAESSGRRSSSTRSSITRPSSS